MTATAPTEMVPSSTAPAARDDRIGAELARLAALDLAGLRKAWRKMIGRAAPDHLPRPLLHRVLAYRLQAAAFGGLDRETARQLDRLGHGKGKEHGGRVSASGADAIPLPCAPTSHPGTILVREWQGQLQQVTVLERGFAWNGVTYDSLSKVARAITGTNWNGPRFFGLRGRAASKAEPRVVGGLTG